MHETFTQAVAEFDEAWVDARHTAVEVPAVAVNEVLASGYTTDPAVRLSGDQVWDMEVRKSWDPLTYIPSVVSEGGSWGATELPDGSRRHLRSSVQEAWIGAGRGRVLEEVYVDPAQRRILFFGRARMTGPDGAVLAAEPFQPLFHVEHAVGGTADAPTNIWRIVVLTEAPDERYRAPFAAMARSSQLPEYLEIYLRRDLGVVLGRR
jgi:hypothetical protein